MMRLGPVKLGAVSIHPGVLECIGATRLGCELEVYGLGMFSKQASPRRKLLLNGLSHYADAVSVISPRDRTEIWFVTSLGKTDVFVPKPVRGEPLPLTGLKVCCNPMAARLLTPMQISSVIVRHRRGDWGDVSATHASSNDVGVQLGREVKSIFTHFRGIEVAVTSIPELIWVSVEATAATLPRVL